MAWIPKWVWSTLIIVLGCVATCCYGGPLEGALFLRYIKEDIREDREAKKKAKEKATEQAREQAKQKVEEQAREQARETREQAKEQASMEAREQAERAVALEHPQSQLPFWTSTSSCSQQQPSPVLMTKPSPA